MSKNIAILGAGGFAREVYWHIKESNPAAQIVFVDDITETTKISMADSAIPVIKDWEFDAVPLNGPNKPLEAVHEFIIGVGDPKIKNILIQKALDSGLFPAATVVHPRALVQGDDNVIGVGGIVTPGCIITTNAKIGDYVLLNLNCTVGHDTIIGDYVTCNPGCCISGNVKIGDNCILGTGTVIREKITVAPGVQTGAQTCVVKDIIDPNVTVVGVPARKIN